LSYGKNSPSGSLENFKKISITNPKLVQKLMVGFPTSNLSIRELVEVFMSIGLCHVDQTCFAFEECSGLIRM
jgi:hypothetical protein